MAGLVAQKKSGSFARTWWGKQVEKALEEPLLAGHKTIRHPVISRARALARNGAVLVMERQGGAVAGEVKGSQLEPFSPLITATRCTSDTLLHLQEAIAGHPGSAEQIIAGDLPRFLAELLPLAGDDLRCECNCPVTEARCAHTMALGYLLVERMDRDPHWYLALRGIELADILTEQEPTDVEKPLAPLATPSGVMPWRESTDTEDESDSKDVSPDRNSLNPQKYWHLSGELPELPSPSPEPAYRSLDEVQWMTVASSISDNPVDKLNLETDIHDAWEHLCRRFTYAAADTSDPTQPSDEDNRGEEEL